MRSKFAKRVAKKAKETLDKFSNNLDSTQQAEALKRNNFAIPPMFATKDIKKQLQEMYGKA